jgi:hypothetical protein
MHFWRVPTGYNVGFWRKAAIALTRAEWPVLALSGPPIGTAKELTSGRVRLLSGDL